MNKEQFLNMDDLFEAMLVLETKEECRKFLEDLCTISELQAITQRWAVARYLDEDIKYQDIAGKTGASTATISRVNRCLVYGAGGYRLVLDRLEKKKEE